MYLKLIIYKVHYPLYTSNFTCIFFLNVKEKVSDALFCLLPYRILNINISSLMKLSAVWPTLPQSTKPVSGYVQSSLGFSLLTVILS